MQRFWEIIKRHPWWILGGVLFGVILIYWLSSGGDSEGEPTVATYSQDPNVVAAKAYQEATQNTNNAAVSIAQLQADSAENLAKTEAGVYSDYFTADTKSKQAELDAYVKLGEASYKSVYDVASIQSTTDISIAQEGTKQAMDLNKTTISLADLDYSKGVLQSVVDLSGLQLAREMPRASDKSVGRIAKFPGTLQVQQSITDLLAKVRPSSKSSGT